MLTGGLIVLTNSRTILGANGVTGSGAALTYWTIVVAWAAAVAWSWRRYVAHRSGDQIGTDRDDDLDGDLDPDLAVV